MNKQQAQPDPKKPCLLVYPDCIDGLCVVGNTTKPAAFRMNVGDRACGLSVSLHFLLYSSLFETTLPLPPHTHIWMVVNGDNVVDFFPDYATVTSVKICHLDIYCGDELLNALVRKKNKKNPNYKQIYENCGNTSIKAVQGFLIWTINYIICVDNMSSYPALEQK